jgi:hypothetical protein
MAARNDYHFTNHRPLGGCFRNGMRLEGIFNKLISSWRLLNISAQSLAKAMARQLDKAIEKPSNLNHENGGKFGD